MRVEDEPLSLREFIRYSDEKWAEQVTLNRRQMALAEESLAELKAQQRALFLILDRMEERGKDG